MPIPKDADKPVIGGANVERNAQDYLDPSINVEEPAPEYLSNKVVDPDAPTAEEIAHAAEQKRLMYQEESDKALGITRSPNDKGQEGVLSPEAKKTLEDSQVKKEKEKK